MPSDEERLLVRMEATLTKFERQMKRAQQVTNTTATGMERRFKAANTQIATTANRAATGIMRITQISGSGRFVLQNTANQLGDIAVQMQTGAGASRVLGQQLPQLLGGFGALGGSLGILAPLLGTVAAIGIPVAAALFAMARDSAQAAEEAKTLADQVDLLTQSTNDYKDAVEANKPTLEDLKRQYGELAEEAKAALESQEALTRQNAEAALKSVSGQLAKDFGISGTVDEVRRQLTDLVLLEAELAQIEERLARTTLLDPGFAEDQQRAAQLRDEIRAASGLRGEIERLGKAYNLTTAEVMQLAMAAAAARDATSVVEKVEALNQLREILVGVYGSVYEANEATDGLVGKIDQAVISGSDLEGITQNLPGSIGASADEAARLAGNLRDAASALLAAKVQVGLVPDVATGGGLPGAPTVPRVPLPPVNRPPARSSGGGGGGRTINAQEAADLAKVRRLYDQTRTSAELYKMELEDLHRLKETGLIDNELFMRSLDDLNEKFQETDKFADQMKASFENLFAGVITGSMSAREALSQFFAVMAQGFARKAAGHIWTGLGLDSLFESFSFDGGGFTGMGPRSGGIDGKGGFPAILHPNETVIDHTKGQGMGVTIVNNIDARGAQVGVAEQIDQALTRRMPQIVATASAARANSLSRGKKV